MPDPSDESRAQAGPIHTIAIAGIAPFSGFFSKDEILWKVFEHGYPQITFWFEVKKLMEPPGARPARAVA